MSNKPSHARIVSVFGIAAMLLAACVNPPSRLGMVKDPETGLQIGSSIEKSFLTDASLFKNRRIKVRIRNTSGDTAFDLYGFRQQIEQAYAGLGYRPTGGDDFGVLLDVNVLYSGQVQSNLSREYAFLGAAAGGVGGYRSNARAGTAIGVLAGATLGSIIGSYVTDDTYIIVARVTFAPVNGPSKRDGKSITFSRSVYGTPDDAIMQEEKRSQRRFDNPISTRIGVFAGGRNVRQSEIAGQVRERFVRIVKDII